MSRQPRLVRPPTQIERIEQLEKRAEVHDKMADQFAEIYAVWDRWKTFNWFMVKIGAGAGAALGFIAVVLTIADKVRAFTGH